MKKFLFYFVLFALCSCTDMNIKVQRIETPTDCVSNDGWSWNNGIATHSSDITGKFEFDSQLPGILSFKYAFQHNGNYYHDLYVYVNDMGCFEVKNYSSDVRTDTLPSTPTRDSRKDRSTGSQHAYQLCADRFRLQDRWRPVWL